MTYNELVDAAKLRARKLSNDVLDEDVKPTLILFWQT